MKKRCLALILAIMLCIGILPTPALAEEKATWPWGFRAKAILSPDSTSPSTS